LYAAGGDDGLAPGADVEKSIKQRELRGVHPAPDGPPSGQAVLADFHAYRAQAYAHQFHYETGATLLYWFGTQPILAHRSHIHPLAKLLILRLFPQR